MIKAECPLCGEELVFTFRFFGRDGRAMAHLQTDEKGKTSAHVSGTVDFVDHSGCTGLVKNTVEFG